MEVSGPVGTGFEAPSAADAKVAIDHNHPVIPFVGRTFYRAGQNAGGILTVIAQLREKMSLCHGVAARIGKIDFGPEIAGWDSVFHLAAYLTRGTANAPPDVNK